VLNSIISHEVEEDDGWEDIDEESGEDPVSECTRNWKAAAPGEKKIWYFSGDRLLFQCLLALSCSLVFRYDAVANCMYGLYFCMRRLLTQFLVEQSTHLPTLQKLWMSSRTAFCSALTSAHYSSLGPAFKRKECHCVVNAFHGYTHNWACQKENHPNVI
jgi:hypothetical protein